MPILDEPMSTKVLIMSCSSLCHLVRTTNSLATPTDDVQRLLFRCRPCPQFYLMAVGVLRPAVHNTLLNIGNMSAIWCTSRSVPPVPTVHDLYCSQQCFTSRYYHSTCHTPPLQKATPFCQRHKQSQKTA
ncbi:hypothetical protein MTO96_027387 [Rhipicephalus appendiculatus]